MAVKLIAAAAILLSLGGCVVYPDRHGHHRGGYYAAPAGPSFGGRSNYGPRGGYYR